MSNKEKSLKKVNIIDLFAILAVVLALIGIAIRFVSVGAKNAKNTTDVMFTVKIDGISEYSARAIEKKGTLTDKDGNYIGEIVDYECKEKTEKTILDNGEEKMVTTPESYTVFITVKGVAKEDDNTYFVGEKTELAAGSNISMFTKHANCPGRVMSVEEIKNQG